MKKSFFVFSTLLAAVFLSTAYADSITGSIGNANASYDLNDFDAFAYYGDPGLALFQTVDGAPSTDIANLAKFSALTNVIPSGAPSNTSSLQTSGGAGNTIAVSYTGGTTPPQSSVSNSNSFYFASSSNGGNFNGVGGVGFSLTTTLFASTETFQFLLENYDTAMDITASLNNAGSTTFSLTDATLPQLWSGSVDSGPGVNNRDGLLTLTVSGAVGETLTLQDVTNLANVSSTGFSNVGIEAVTVEAVPEPATYALMGVGVLALVWRLRRKSGMA